MNEEMARKLEARLAKLERKNRWLLGCLLLLPLIMFSLGAAAAQNDSLKVKELIVDKGPIVLTDGNRNRVAIGVNDKGFVYLNVFDKDGNWYRGLGEERKTEDFVRTKELFVDKGIIILNDGARNRIAIGVNNDGVTFVNVFDRQGKWVKALGEEQP